MRTRHEGIPPGSASASIVLRAILECGLAGQHDAMIPSPIALLILAAGTLASTAYLPHWLLCFCLLGATEAIALPALGGSSVVPGPAFLPFLLVRTLRERGRLFTLRRVARPIFWGWALALWGALAAFFLPQIFAGDVLVMMNDRSTSTGVSLIPLRPMSGNLVQLVYLVGGTVGMTCIRSLLHTEARRDHFADAVLLVGTLNAVATVLNITTFYLHLPDLLTPIKTANYAIQTPRMGAAGLLRLQGTFPEPSTYSGFTLPIFTYCLSLWMHRYRPVYSGSLALLSLIFLAISTSGTAYVALTLYMVVWLGHVAWKGFAKNETRHTVLTVVGTTALATVLMAILIFLPAVVERIWHFLDVSVFSKAASKSGAERAAWNAQAWQNFLDSYGFGLGVGAARASSFPLAVLSNVGAVGMALMCTFIASVARTPAVSGEPLSPPVAAARQAMLAALLAVTVSGTVMTPDLMFYTYAGVAASRVRAPGAPSG